MGNRILIEVLLLFTTGLFAQPNVIYRDLNKALKNPEQVYKLNLNAQSFAWETKNNINGLNTEKVKGKSVLPMEIKKLKNLKSLVLDFNKLDSFPCVILELESLEELKMTDCNLKSLPEDIYRLKNLTRLNLSGNSLITLPSSLSKLKALKSLDVRSNLITTFPTGMDSLQNLEYFYNSYNFKIKFNIIPDFVLQIQSIRRIELEADQSTASEELKKLANLKNLKILNLFLDVDSFPKELFNLTQIEELHMQTLKKVPLSENFKKLINLKTLFFPNHPEIYDIYDQKKIRYLLPNCKDISL